jgi:hypothetical protein
MFSCFHGRFPSTLDSALQILRSPSSYLEGYAPSGAKTSVPQVVALPTYSLCPKVTSLAGPSVFPHSASKAEDVRCFRGVMKSHRLSYIYISGGVTPESSSSRGSRQCVVSFVDHALFAMCSASAAWHLSCK